MAFLNHWLLTILLLLPLAGAAAICFVRRESAVRWTAVGVSLASVCVSLAALIPFHRQRTGAYSVEPDGTVQMAVRSEWAPAVHAGYAVALDGLSFPFVVLTTILGAVACVGSLGVTHRVALHCILLLLLESTTLATLLAFDLLMIWVCLTLMILPASLLIRTWGTDRRVIASRKFTVLLLIASACLLIGTLAIHHASASLLSGGTFDLLRLSSLPIRLGAGATALMLLGLLIRLAFVPFHGWVADVIAESSPTASFLVIALFPLTGGYLLLRLLTLFAARPALAALGLIGALYGAMVMIGRPNPARVVSGLVAASGGFVLLGLSTRTVAGLNGAALVVLAQALITGMMALLLTSLVARGAHLDRVGGLGQIAPAFASLLGVAWLAELTLPGLVAKLSVLAGLANSWGLASGAILAILLIAVAAVRLLRQILGGPAEEGAGRLIDLTNRERAQLVPLAVLTILLGIFPAALCFSFTTHAIEAIFRLPH